MNKKFFVFLLAIIFAGVGIFWYYQSDSPSGQMSYDEAVEKIDRIAGKTNWSENIVTRKAKIQLGKAKDLKDTLPNIKDVSKMVVNPHVSANDVCVEIFTSSEKSGKGIDGIMVEIANDFNAKNIRLSNGAAAKVRIRKIASGTGYQFIASKKHLPDGFSPSNHLWVRMAEAHGIKMTKVRDQMFENIAGVVMKTAVAEKLRAAYGSVNVENIIDAVVQGKMLMGYTNPFASSTGLNYLITVLATFAKGNHDIMLSPEVVSSFEGFQKGVPFVALTTMQMRDSVENDGSLEAFVMEYQTFANASVLKSGYEFIPFGIRHDNPLYGVGEISREKLEVLSLLASFSEEKKYKKLARKYGFSPEMKYDSSYKIPSGDILIRAQKIWKEKKDTGRPVSAIFLCDVSGSMAGTRIKSLKNALIKGSEFISPENSIGIVLFESKVRLVLPVKKFGLSHKAGFHAAVQDMSTGGGTAMYDGVAVSLSLLAQEKNRNPDIKPILFVLTDGETNEGLTFNKIRNAVKFLGIPVYTIGYEANIGELKKLSSLVEAASFNAGQGQIEYKIGTLLNAQM